MIKLDDALAGVKNLGLDTAPVIYFVEKHPRYDALVTEIFRRIDNGIIVGITSVITFTEVLVQPIRRDDANLQQEYSALLLNSADFETMPIDAETAKRAALCAPNITCALPTLCKSLRLWSLIAKRF